MKPDKTYVYAPSMATLVYAFQRYNIENLIIVSANEQINLFCSKVGIAFVPFPKLHGYTRKELIEYRDTISNFSKEFIEQKFLFCYYGFDIWGLYFIEQLEKVNSIYFSNQDIEHKQSTIKINKAYFRKKLDQIILQKITGLLLKIYEIDNTRYFLGAPLNHLNSTYSPPAEEINPEIYYANKQLIKSKYDLDSMRFIFVDQGNVAFSLPTELLKNIESIIHNNKELLFVKKHPNFKISNQVLLEIGKQLPQEIPIELILDNDSYLIGIVSTSLITHGKGISLVNLVEWKSEVQKRNYIKILQNTEIPQPADIELLKNELLTTFRKT